MQTLSLRNLFPLLLVSSWAFSSIDCGPVVVPYEDESAGAAGRTPTLDLCKQVNPPEFCQDAGHPPSTCSANQPNDHCTSQEDCSCEDCQDTARCKELCVEDGVCSLSEGEDCSCKDCEGKIADCAYPRIGCVTNGVCSPLEDDCICPDCTQDKQCQSCTKNGFCSGFIESCSCEDCSREPLCHPGH